MFVFRLGILSFLLSECLVSGFTTGAAIHVATSQVKDLLGLELPRITGNFKLIKVSFCEWTCFACGRKMRVLDENLINYFDFHCVHNEGRFSETLFFKVTYMVFLF